MQHEAATKDTLIIGKDGSFLLSKMQGAVLRDGLLEVNVGGLIFKITPIGLEELAQRVKAKDKVYGLGIGTPAIYPDAPYCPLPERTAYLLADNVGNVEVCGECGFILKLAGNGITVATENYLKRAEEAKRQWSEKYRLLALKKLENPKGGIRNWLRRAIAKASKLIPCCALLFCGIVLFHRPIENPKARAGQVQSNFGKFVTDNPVKSGWHFDFRPQLLGDRSNGLIPLFAAIPTDREVVRNVVPSPSQYDGKHWD